MAVILALVEGGSIFGALCWMLVASGRPRLEGWGDVAAALGQAAALTACVLAVLYYHDLYDLRVVRSFADFAVRLPRCAAVSLVSVAGFSALLPAPGLTRASAVPAALIVLALLATTRAAAYAVLRQWFAERVLILGTSPLARSLVGEIEARPDAGYVVVGLVDDGVDDGGLRFAYPRLGPLERLGKIIDEVRPDRIVVALRERRGRLPDTELLEARVRGIVVEDAAEVYERLAGKLAIEFLTPSSVVFSRDFRGSGLGLALSRALSVLAAGIGLALLAPLLGLIALAIKLDSAGPVLFVQERVGLNRRPFKLLKFRTMHPVDRPSSEWVRDNTDRITRVGRWLRRFRLDELPQFVNILRGEMNLVGPRPHPVSNLGLFVVVLRNAPECGEPIPYYSLRSTVRPGVTGWAQVRYRYANDLEEEIEKMRYDLYYVKYRSLWLDLRILFDTVKIVLLGRESADAEVHARDARPAERLEPAA